MADRDNCVPASAVGANHTRERLFIVAYPNSDREVEQGQNNNYEEWNSKKIIQEWGNVKFRIDSTSLNERESIEWATEPRLGRVAHGVSPELDGGRLCQKKA